MAELSEEDVAAQLATQLHWGELYEEGELAPLFDCGGSVDVTTASLRAIRDAVTHAAQTPLGQLRALELALARLVRSVPDLGSDWDYFSETRPTQVQLALAAFARELEAGRVDELDVPSLEFWGSREATGFDRAARVAAEPLLGRVRQLGPFRSSGDRRAVADRRQAERDLPANERFDTLGWEIFLLSLARGHDAGESSRQAMDGVLRLRQEVRRDLLMRSQREAGGQRRLRQPTA